MENQTTEQPNGHPQPPPSSGQGDKFAQFTKKAASGIEQGVGTAYKTARTVIAHSGEEHERSRQRLDRLIEWTRTAMPAQQFEDAGTWCVRYGHLALFWAKILAIVFGLVAAFKLSNWVFIPYGVGLAVLLAILQYTAEKFLNAGDSLIKSSPSPLGSAAFLDCLALLAEVIGILLFIGFIFRARQLGQWSLVWVGLGIWALCSSVACIALHPSLTNTSVSDDVRAGEEAIGIMSFLVKAVVRIVPLAFGVGTVLGTIALLFATVSLMRTGLMVAGASAMRLIVLCTCLPFASYVFFAFYHLTIDILRAILILPRKLDEACRRG